MLLVAIAICGYSQGEDVLPCQSFIATFTTSPSIVSITTSSESEQFVVGDRILFTFDQDVRCGEYCQVIFISDKRALSIPVDVCVRVFGSQIGLDD